MKYNTADLLASAINELENTLHKLHESYIAGNQDINLRDPALDTIDNIFAMTKFPKRDSIKEYTQILRDVYKGIKHDFTFSDMVSDINTASGVLLHLYLDLTNNLYDKYAYVDINGLGYIEQDGININDTVAKNTMFKLLCEQENQYLPMNIVSVSTAVEQDKLNDGLVNLHLLGTKYHDQLADNVLDRTDYGAYIVNKHRNQYDVAVYNTNTHKFEIKYDLTRDNIIGHLENQLNMIQVIYYIATQDMNIPYDAKFEKFDKIKFKNKNGSNTHVGNSLKKRWYTMNRLK